MYIFLPTNGSMSYRAETTTTPNDDDETTTTLTSVTNGKKQQKPIPFVDDINFNMSQNCHDDKLRNKFQFSV